MRNSKPHAIPKSKKTDFPGPYGSLAPNSCQFYIFGNSSRYVPEEKIVEVFQND